MIKDTLKKDIKGRLYSDDTDNLPNRQLLLNECNTDNSDSKNIFYSLNSTNDYIIKRPKEDLNWKERKDYMKMLVSLSQKQNKITRTEFPIGYYREKRKLAGLIVRYYQNGISLEQIMNKRNLNLLKKYYSHSEDNIKNIIMLLDDYLECIFELYNNYIWYLDNNRF